MRKRWAIRLAAAAALCILLLAASPAEALQQGPSGSVYIPVVQNRFGAQVSDCAVIQSAINALPVEGGQVTLGVGTYVCTTAVVIDRDNVTLVGQGTSTRLRLAERANAPVLVIGQTSTPPGVERKNIRVANLLIDGNRGGQTLECWGGRCDTGGRTYIRNNGITLRRVSDVVIENVTVTAARSGGMVTEKGCQRLTVQNFNTYDNYFDGLAAYETENSLFTHLYLHDNPYAGLSIDIRFNNNIVSQAVITGNGRQGIFMRDSRSNIFNGIQIRDSGQQGIFVAQVDNDTTKAAVGNLFTDLNVSGSTLAGLHVNDASCVDNQVTTAQFRENDTCVYERVPGLVLQSQVICR